MTSSATRGLLAGVGQGLAMAGEMGLKDHYESLRQKKAQEYKLEGMSVQNEYATESQNRNFAHDETMTATAQENAEGLLNKSRDFELEDQSAAIAREDAKIAAQNTREDKLIQEERDYQDKNRKPSDKSLDRENKTKLQYLKRVQELEDAFNDPMNPISKEQFERGIAAARQNYGISSPVPQSQSKEDILLAGLKHNGLSDTPENRANLSAQLAASGKYGAMFKGVGADGDGDQPFNTVTQAQRQRAEQLRIEREEENRRKFKEQERALARKKQEDEALSAIHKYRLTQ